MFIASNKTCFCRNSWCFFSFILISGKIKLSIILAGTIPDNTSGFDKVLCSGVEVLALLTSREVSAIKDVFSPVDVG